MAFSALWSVLILSAIPISRSDVTLHSLSGAATINVEEGETVSFVCYSGSIGGPEILQINNNINDSASSRVNVSNDSEVTASGGTVYEFSNIARDDNGTLFQCFINAVPSNYLTLIVNLPPKYVPDTYSYTVIEGTPLRIQLQLEALRAVTSFNWTKDGSDIQSNTGVTLGADYIDFGKVSREDTGTYRVSAEDSAGTGDALLTLEVYYPPKFVAGSGVVNYSAITDSSFSLDCSWSANPSGNLQVTFQDDALVNNYSDDSQFVMVEGANASYEGRYICTAENSIAITQLIYNVLIGVLPTVVVEMDVSLNSEAVVLQGTYKENNLEDPVIRFYVTVDDNTVTATPDEMSSFSVTLSYDGLEVGTTYTVYVTAENAIGNGTRQSPQMFTVPEATDGSSGTAGNLHMIGTWVLVLALITAILL